MGLAHFSKHIAPSLWDGFPCSLGTMDTDQDHDHAQLLLCNSHSHSSPEGTGVICFKIPFGLWGILGSWHGGGERVGDCCAGRFSLWCHTLSSELMSSISTSSSTLPGTHTTFKSVLTGTTMGVLELCSTATSGPILTFFLLCPSSSTSSFTTSSWVLFASETAGELKSVSPSPLIMMQLLTFCKPPSVLHALLPHL